MTESSRKRRGWRYWRNMGVFALAAGCIGLLFFMYVGHPYYLSRGWAHPRRLAVCCMTPVDYGLNYKEISFTTSDGLTLQGWYIPSANGAAVILTHPLASNRVGVLETAYMLARNRYGVLLFDLRAHGESQGEVLPFGGAEAEDVVAAAAYLQRHEDIDPDRIGAMGLSLGAQVSILGAARSETIKAVVAEGPCCTTFEDWPRPQSLGEWLYVPYDFVFFRMLQWHTGVSEPMSVQEAIARIAPRSVLLIGGGSERNVLEYHYRTAQEPKVLWIIPEAGHSNGLSTKPEEYEERIVGFFDQVLLGENQFRPAEADGSTPLPTVTPWIHITPTSTRTPVVEGPPTPYCRPSEASISLSPSTTELEVGQTVTVIVRLVNGETSEAKLGWILYRLRIEPDILTLESAETVEHTLTLEPGDWDQAEFVLRAVEPGRVTISGLASYEMHALDYSWGSNSGCYSQALEIVITSR